VTDDKETTVGSTKRDGPFVDSSRSPLRPMVAEVVGVLFVACSCGLPRYPHANQYPRGRVRQSPHLASPNPSSAEEWRNPVVPRGSDDPRIVASHDTLLRIEHLEAATASSSAQSAKLAKVLSDTV